MYEPSSSCGGCDVTEAFVYLTLSVYNVHRKALLCMQAVDVFH